MCQKKKRIISKKKMRNVVPFPAPQPHLKMLKHAMFHLSSQPGYGELTSC